MNGRALIALAAAALVLATSASSRPTQGISVTVAPVIVALSSFDDASGVATIKWTTAARWNPEAVSEDVFITITYPDGAKGGGRAGVSGAAPHSHNKYSAIAPAFAGQRVEFRAKWQVYNVGGTSGEGQSGKTTYTVPKKEPAPRLPDNPKEAARALSYRKWEACVSHTIVMLLGCGLGYTFERLAADPIDLNFRSIAKPRIPVVPKFSPPEGLSAAAEEDLNDLLALQAREIGFGKAIATAFDRSQGAHVKKAIDWEKKQVRASGTYAAQLAKALLAEASLWPRVRAALADSAFADITVSYEDALAFGESLVWRGLPAEMAANLTKLGFTKAEQREIRAQVATIDPGLYDGDVMDALPNARDIGNLRKLAAGLKAFARKAAKTPLATRPP